MKFLNNFERKFGKYAVPNLMKYILILYAAGTVLNVLMPDIYLNYLCLDFSMIAKGQIWRLVTFIMAPYSSSLDIVTILFFAIELYLYYMIGTALEQTWGAFRFNMYIYSGILFNIIAGLIVYVIYGQVFPGANVIFDSGLEYIFQSMFLAFAFLYPDVQLLLMMVIPIKIKWLGYLYGLILVVEIVSCFMSGQWVSIVAGGACYVRGIAMLVAMMNFLLFFLWSWKVKRPSAAQMKRRREFKKQVRTMSNMSNEPRHRCAICGRTEQDNPNLEFRFCSRCNGNYEYCSDHLFTHEHVK